MEKAASVNEHFKFSGTIGKYGLSIDCINNLCDDADREFYWGVVVRTVSILYGAISLGICFSMAQSPGVMETTGMAKTYQKHLD